MKKQFRTEQKPDRIKTANRKGRFFFLLPLGLIIILLLPLISQAENLTCNRFPMLMGKFYAYHFSMKKMTGDVKTHAVDQMLKRLDPSKTLLYESDLEILKPLLREMFANSQDSNCTSLKPVYDLLVTRARENESIVKKILGPDFRPDETAKLNINIDKRPYSKTVTEKQALLRKIVQFQIENYLLSGLDLATAKKQQIHSYELQTKRIVEQNPSQLITTSAESFAVALDPHTSYLSSKNLEDLQIQMQLSLEGIGAVLKGDNGFTVIEELIPGGGAERSGMLKVKDKIIAVTQEGEKPVNVIDMDLRDVVTMIRGKKGTKVTLTILRQNKSTERFNITITRDKIDMKEQEAKISYETRTEGNRKYTFGIIDLPSFYGGVQGGKSSSEDVKKLLAEARTQRVDGIVLNLSRNGGGLLDEAVRIAGLFIGKGGIVATEDSKGKVKILANGSSSSLIEGWQRKVISFPAEDSKELYSGPLVVLTSRLSASASEIVAGALKDYRRAVIAGSDHTFGKGSVQSLIPLPRELGGMKVTTALYFLPGGKSTQKTGVAADVKLPGFFATEDLGEAELDYPLPAQSIAPFLNSRDKISPHWKPVDQRLISELVSKSQARVAKNAKFAEIIKNNKEAAEKKGIIQLADFRKMIEKEGGNKENETLLEQKQKILDQYAPFVNESVNILLDMITL